jgi:hypothetical protein
MWLFSGQPDKPGIGPAGMNITALYPDTIPPRIQIIHRALRVRISGRKAARMTARKDLLSGSSDEVSARLEELARGFAHYEYAGGTRLRLLAIELTKRPNLKVSVVTYENESQELEVAFTDDPKCDPIMIDRDAVGENCQITWDRWLSISNDRDIRIAADMVAGVLNTCARFVACEPQAQISEEKA